MHRPIKNANDISIAKRPLPWRWILLLSLCLGFVLTGVAEDIFKVVDKDGKVIFTDTPPVEGNASRLKVSPVNQLPATRIGGGGRVEEVEDRAFTGYTRVEITQPENDTTIHYQQESVSVALTLSPELQPGHLVHFFLDAQPQGRPVANTEFEMAALQRVSHSLSARVISSQGLVIGPADPIVIHVQRPLKRN